MKGDRSANAAKSRVLAAFTAMNRGLEGFARDEEGSVKDWSRRFHVSETHRHRN